MSSDRPAGEATSPSEGDTAPKPSPAAADAAAEGTAPAAERARSDEERAGTGPDAAAQRTAAQPPQPAGAEEPAGPVPAGPREPAGEPDRSGEPPVRSQGPPTGRADAPSAASGAEARAEESGPAEPAASPDAPSAADPTAGEASPPGAAPGKQGTTREDAAGKQTVATPEDPAAAQTAVTAEAQTAPGDGASVDGEAAGGAADAGSGAGADKTGSTAEPTAAPGDTGPAGPQGAEPPSTGAAVRESARPSGAGRGADGAGGPSPASSTTAERAADGRTGGGKRSAAAEALAAAVRAVERGEAEAASFFTGPSGRPGTARSGGTRPPQGGPEQPAPSASAPASSPGGAGGPGLASTRPARPGPAGAHATASGPAAAPGPAGSGGQPAPGGQTGGPVADPFAEAGTRQRRAQPGAAPAVPGEESMELAPVRQVLAAGGAPEQLAGQVVRALGERAAPLLQEDPWQLLTVPGVRPEQADGFARALLGSACGPGDERRSRALVGWLLERAALEGHTARESTALRDALSRHGVPDPDQALRDAIADGGVLVFQDALETPGAAPAAMDEEDEQPVRVLLGLDRYALAEESLADGLARLVNTFEAAPPAGEADSEAAARALPAWEALAEAAPSPSAAELIRTAAGHGLVTHSGGDSARAEPVALVAAAHARGLRAYAAAHSDDGRRRLADALAASGLPAAQAVTVAGLLSGAEGPGRDAEGALALDLLAVLDAPQLDVEAAAALVESLPDGGRLVLSGDPGVLGSAGPGRVFADVVAARACPQVVSRTPDPGPIGELVSGIGVGELQQVAAPGKEVVIVPVRDAGEAVHRTVQLVADSVPRAIGVPAAETQVITVGHGGAVGTRALNAALKERLNSGPGRFGGFDPGDRVAHAVAPGRTTIGTVVAAEPEGLRLNCGGEEVRVERARVADALRHGWAITAHQAAGGRWPAAVVVLPGDAGPLLTRAWVYTAFSRGERHLSVVHGAGQALPRAVAEVPATERTTRLRALLRAQTPAV